MCIINFLDKWGEFAISVIALIVSIFSLRKSLEATQLQKQINEIELKLKAYDLEKIEREKAEQNLSCVEARVISIGKGRYRLKVYNSGNVPTYAVMAKILDAPDIIIIDKEKQPYDVLEVGKNYELALAVYDCSTLKFKIITEWTDPKGEKKSKIQMGDI